MAKRNSTVAKQHDPAASNTRATFSPIDNLGDKKHSLTTEDRRKGQIAAAKKKKELARTVRERLAARLQDEADELFDAFVESSKRGDWRALAEALNQAFGRPASQLELTGAIDNTISIQVVSSLAVPALESDVYELPAGDVQELDEGD